MVENSSKKAKVQKEELKGSDYNNFRLMRAIKENHGLPINQVIMGFNSKQLSSVEKMKEGSYASEVDMKDLSNLVMSVSGSQINIYDNEHYGDHLDLMCHFNYSSRRFQRGIYNLLLD
ncbi:hypothetical protein DSO57_1037431 [Entomophthora muscae]|uniref:Uncharacterized protein n=2 Tax=Entomophthora muscae TaxID=34485 RepID=A0ACC2SZH6_9FUNG|nr:hypothetical protein DSO57_1036666 [Entomophthora muscae]KAJ9087019.1 hypothetical protein DSO57_1037431 [Entomophthora muscae]